MFGSRPPQTSSLADWKGERTEGFHLTITTAVATSPTAVAEVVPPPIVTLTPSLYHSQTIGTGVCEEVSDTLSYASHPPVRSASKTKSGSSASATPAAAASET
mgnify:CR=1 FL=1